MSGIKKIELTTTDILHVTRLRTFAADMVFLATVVASTDAASEAASVLVGTRLITITSQMATTAVET